MNEKALRTAYSLFKQEGYNGSVEEFVNLLKKNEKAKKVAYDLFSQQGYENDINAFSGLIGLDKIRTADGNYILDDYIEDEKGRRSYKSMETGNYDLKEVGYNYDRSKGIRIPGTGLGASYGKYLDDFAYNLIRPTFDITVDAVKSAQSGEYTDAMNEILINGSKGMDEEKASEIIKLMQSQQGKGPSKNIKSWAEEMEKENNPVYGFLKATWNNPAAAYEATISSIAGQLSATQDGELLSLALAAGGTTAAVGSTAGPIGTVAGFLRGFMSTMGGGVETASKFGELIVQEFVDEENPNGRMPTEEELVELINDPVRFNKFRNKAISKGATIALVDNIGGSIVQNSVFKTARKGKKVLAATKGLIGESIVGGGGEALSSAVIGEEISATDVGLEILGQGGQSVVDVGSALITPGKYQINGEKASLQEVNKVLNTATPAELANIDITVENDPVLENEVNRKKQKAYLNTQIEAEVSNENDRERLVDLQEQKNELEAKLKKGGIFKGVNTDSKLASVNNEISSILNKYATETQVPLTAGPIGPSVDPTGVETRRATAKKVKDARIQSVIKELNKKAASEGRAQIKTVKDLADYVGKKTGLNINVDNGNSQQFEAFLLGQEERGANRSFQEGILSAMEEVVRDPNSTREEINEAQQYIKLASKQINIAKGELQNYGNMYPEVDADGNVTGFNLFINEETSVKDGMLNTAAHEFFHAAIFSTLKGNIEAQMSLGDALMRVLKSKGAKLKPGSTINDEISQYKEGEGLGEEILAITAANFDDIEIKEGFVQGLRDIWRRFGQKYLNKEIRFDTDQDVLNFVKDYAKTIKDPKKINKALVAVIANGAKGKLLEGIDIESGPKVGEAFSKQASDRVQEIYNEKGEAGIFDIIQQFKPIVKKLVDKRSDAPGFDRQLLTDEIETGLINEKTGKQRSIMGLVKDYPAYVKKQQEKRQKLIKEGKQKEADKVKIAPLAGFINNLLPERMIEASREILGEEFTQDVTERVDIAAEEVAEPTVVEQKQDEARTLSNFDIELEDGLVDAEIEAETQSLIEENPDNLVERMEKLILGEIRKKLDNAVGKIAKNKETGKVEPTPEYEKFIRSEFEENVNSLGIDVIRKSYKPWFDQVKTGTKDYKNIDPVTGIVSNYRKDTFINKANKPKYLKFFLQGKPNVLRERRTALLRRIARRKAEIAIDKYIESNSANIDAVVEAKLRQISRTAKNIQNEQTSFDSVRFSKAIPSRIKKYKAMPEFKNKTKGHILEQVIIDMLKSYGLPTKYLKVTVDQAMEKGSIADVNLEVDSKPVRVEIKLDENVIMGGVLVTDLQKAEVATNSMQNSIDFEGILKKSREAINSYINAYNKKITAYNTKHGTNEPLMSLENPIGHNVVESIYNELKTEGYMEAIIKAAPTRSINAQPLIDHYLNKFAGAVTEIEIFGKGMYSFTENSVFGPNVPYIKNMARVQTKLRVYKSGGKLTYRNADGDIVSSNVKVMREGKMQNDRYVRFQLQFQNTLVKGSLKDPKNPVSLTRKQDMVLNLGIPLKENLATPFSKAINKARTTQFSKEAKGITILDFDDTLATTESLVKYTALDGTTGTLNAEQFASTYENLQNQGYTFDFSDFNKVVEGKLAPLFQKALKLQKKFGPENMFVLTARPPKAQKAIFDFLKANGLNIPLKNITGLGNSTAEAKALWVADKVAEGYNDFYFADDALQNVQAVDNMLEQFDVKRKVQQARSSFSKNISPDFNKILEDVTGIEAAKRFSDVKARKRGEKKGKFRFFIPPSHEDFVGLLYNFMGKGRKGDAHRDFFENALIRPLNRGYRELDAAKQAIANDYKSLNKQFPDVKSKLTKKTPDGDFTFQDAIRVYLWTKNGHTIPGLSATDQSNLSDVVTSDPSLQAYAETLNLISKQDRYVDPKLGWEGGNIRIDLIDATGRVGRAQYFTEFNENAEAMFSEENLNKIEAAYGASFRSALEDMLHRISTGVNRPKGQSATVNKFMNYLNGSVGAVMFFNARSAILQQMSIVNYINFADNNPLAAAKAFANQPQYWKDFAFIFNSDMLKQRRGGIGTDINGAELAEAVSKSKNPTRAAIGYLLKLGFLPTQIGDNIAIATGGATFYRNRIKTYEKQGFSKKEAQEKAFNDFQDITQSTQQSARPDKTSQQQSMWIGKLVLNFQNITSQYNRIIKRAAQDIYNRRITKPNTTQFQSDASNMSRILYYGAIQNVIFYSLQSALFAVMFGDEDDDNEKYLKKKERVISGTIDSILRGSGIYGVAVSTLKNMAQKWHEQRDKKYNKDESAVIMEALNFSPVVGIKARKIVNAEKTLNYNKDVIKEMETFDIDNPIWSSATNYIEALTNFPANRLYQKTINLRNALDNDYSAWQRALFFSGYTTWSLGLEDTKKMQVIKETVKTKKREAQKERAKIKREERKKEKEEENKAIIEKNKKKKDGRCAAISSNGKRCSNKAIKDGFCTIHEKTEKISGGRKVQCRKRKADGTRCKMMTNNKSQFCYYHD